MLQDAKMERVANELLFCLANGRRNIDCVGKFRRRVNSKGSVAYYRPAVSDTYKAKLAYAESQRIKKP